MGVLTIRPGFRERKGKPDFYARREEIKAIVVEVGVSKIGDGWFNYLNEVREISLPTTLRRIGKSAFASCERLKEVCIPFHKVFKAFGRKHSAIVARSPR